MVLITPIGRSVQSLAKKSAHRWVAKTTQGPRDGCAIALLGGTGVRPPRDSEWGKDLPGASGRLWGGMYKALP